MIARAVGKKRQRTRRWRRCCGAGSRRARQLPGAVPRPPRAALARALTFAERVAAEPAAEPSARRAATALYHATTAVLLAWEGAHPGVDPRRALLARFVLDHRLSHSDPLAPDDDDAFEHAAIDLVLGDGDLAPAEAMRLL